MFDFLNQLNPMHWFEGAAHEQGHAHHAHHAHHTAGHVGRRAAPVAGPVGGPKDLGYASHYADAPKPHNDHPLTQEEMHYFLDDEKPAAKKPVPQDILNDLQ